MFHKQYAEVVGTFIEVVSSDRQVTIKNGDTEGETPCRRNAEQVSPPVLVWKRKKNSKKSHTGQ